MLTDELSTLPDPSSSSYADINMETDLDGQTTSAEIISPDPDTGASQAINRFPFCK